MPTTRLRQLVCVLTILLAPLAVPHRVGAQVADLVSVDFTQRPDWAGEVWPADFDRDGITDVTFLTTPAAGSALAMARGRGDGTFDPAQIVATGTGSPIGVGDLNGDGLTDIVTATHVVPGRGDGSFDVPIAYASPSSTQIAPAQVVDMNGDGHTDLVRLMGSTGSSSTIIGR